MIVPESRDFPTIAYDEERAPRPPENATLPENTGNAAAGKALTYNPGKGRCLACHMLGPDSEQPGDLGPNLSDYGKRGFSHAYTYQQIWDARVHNQDSAMPPFGTNELLSAAEIMDIVAYLHTLTTPVAVPGRPKEPQRSRRERVFVAGEDLSVADDYVDAGRAAFRRPGNNGRACASCHAAGEAGDDISRAAARFPRFDEAKDAVVTLEDRVNMCRETHMDSPAIEYGSRAMNVLTSYLRHLSRGQKIQVSAEGPAAEAFERGRSLYYRRAGQLNYSCAECHAKHSGKWLRGQYLRPLDDVSGDWPKHFIAGHDLGLISMQQRIRHCQIVTRTYPLELGSREYAELEFYMTVLSEGTPVLAPTRSRLRGE
ncbi:sulfur oxidation c-type cytochrome SoxA [Thioalkalivibrio thiocyanodenitrificans]|uniref:sulfur oxidation c-type cytochrome SoxA n=1 Tax=Thioalkalivibrio thiocyanodenitrificans TaxID=243063 RepID=UPI000379FF67|nr:sulfur oxidation c-type cytochrome SoxA [Thioalkalivibrio thiocyanodenitrificans]